MIFDWDENKNQMNIVNHDGVSFDAAAQVFDDYWAIDELDFDHSTDNEKRFTIIGLAEAEILRVTYTIVSNEPEIIRIISARKAKGIDKRSYEQYRNEFDENF